MHYWPTRPTMSSCSPHLPVPWEGGRFRGRAGIGEYFRITAETWGEFRILAEEFRDLGDRVLVVGRVCGLGKGSRVPVEAPNAIVMDFQGDKAWRVQATSIWARRFRTWLGRRHRRRALTSCCDGCRRSAVTATRSVS